MALVVYLYMELTGGGAALFGFGEVLGDLLVEGVGCGIEVKT